MRKNVEIHEVIGQDLLDLPLFELLDFGIVKVLNDEASPMEILEEIEGLLRPHGLEVVIYESEGDAYWISILPRKE